MIPVAKPTLGEEEAAAARDVILSGWVTQGPRVQEFEAAFAESVGASHACAVSSCTTALHLSLLAVGVRPGDVVATVSHSFVATANAVRHCGAEPIFVDIEPRTFNMSAAALRRFFDDECETRDGALYLRDTATIRGMQESPVRHLAPDLVGRVAAIMPVHQVGMPCDLPALTALAKTHGLPVVEDAACATGSLIDCGSGWEAIGRPRGDVACFSFHPRKVMTTGDGGMLTTNNEDVDRRCRLLRHHGMGVSDAVRHASNDVVFEAYETTGYNFRMTDIQAAIGIEQLKRLPEIVRRRREVAAWYAEKLADVAGVEAPHEPSYARSNWQSYIVTIAAGLPQKEIMRSLMAAGVSTRRGVMCSHLERPYADGGRSGRLPESEAARDRGIILPLYPELTESDVDAVVDAVRRSCAGREARA